MSCSHSSKKALLALADGSVYVGKALGYEGETCGEVVFHTAMTGYQEIVTDPSYRGQIVTMTCPHIGNYGVTREDEESGRMWMEGFIVKESCHRPSNWRAEQSLHEYLVNGRVVGIEGIDTRALTRHLRDHGSQQGVISHVDLDPHRAIHRAQSAPGIAGRDLVSDVTCATPYEWVAGSGGWVLSSSTGGGTSGPNPKPFRVVVYDFGVKHTILRRLVDVGCSVKVVRASTSAEDVLAMQPDGILLSNGPGDPEAVGYAVKHVQQLIGRHPMLGICLGHQILGLALGLTTTKLKFGHHGANHPVMDLRSRTVEITSQNHNFTVQAPSVLDPAQHRHPVGESAFGPVSFTHLSLDDHSVEGMVCLDHPVLSVQYHPEASPGPHDSSYVFQQFTAMMRESHA